eukprot:TRINITY_DN6962_c0_g2_i1.p1 TRINITY_DN6962_c0_g2~~TRINITY_DN6962_c0_g2_i1.p1  ORF type:complete len:1443 (-),score=212.90 TRINITY_DN6962_c0_g2_i1:159-3968(-)
MTIRQTKSSRTPTRALSQSNNEWDDDMALSTSMYVTLGSRSSNDSALSEQDDDFLRSSTPQDKQIPTCTTAEELRYADLKRAAREKEISAASKTLSSGTATLASGQLWIWGMGRNGKYDKLTRNYKEPRPMQFPELKGVAVSSVACSASHVLIASADGAVYALGLKKTNPESPASRRRSIADSSGFQLYPLLTPHLVEELKDHFIAKVACGIGLSVLLSDEGKVFTLGNLHTRQLGGTFDVSLYNGSRPTLIKNISSQRVIDISCGAAHALLLTESGSVYSFGSGEMGALGHGFFTGDLRSPKKILALSDIRAKAIAAGESFSLVLSKQGEIYSFGCGDHGQLGHKKGNLTGYRALVPRKITSTLSGIKITKIAAGHDHSMAVTDRGKLYMWGSNNNHKLGFHSSGPIVPLPKKIKMRYFRAYAETNATLNNAPLVEADGTLVPNPPPSPLFSGFNSLPVRGATTRLISSQVAQPASPYRRSPIPDFKSTAHTSAPALLELDSDIKVIEGPLDPVLMADPLPSPIVSPRSPSAIISPSASERQRITHIAAGYSHSVAVANGGRIFPWGSAAWAQLGHGDERQRKRPALVRLLTGAHVIQTVATSGLTLAVMETATSVWADQFTPALETDSAQAHAGLVAAIAPNLTSIRKLLAVELAETVSTLKERKSDSVRSSLDSRRSITSLFSPMRKGAGGVQLKTGSGSGVLSKSPPQQNDNSSPTTTTQKRNHKSKSASHGRKDSRARTMDFGKLMGRRIDDRRKIIANPSDNTEEIVVTRSRTISTNDENDRVNVFVESHKNNEQEQDSGGSSATTTPTHSTPTAYADKSECRDEKEPEYDAGAKDRKGLLQMFYEGFLARHPKLVKDPSTAQQSNDQPTTATAEVVGANVPQQPNSTSASVGQRHSAETVGVAEHSKRNSKSPLLIRAQLTTAAAARESMVVLNLTSCSIYHLRLSSEEDALSSAVWSVSPPSWCGNIRVMRNNDVFTIYLEDSNGELYDHYVVKYAEPQKRILAAVDSRRYFVLQLDNENTVKIKPQQTNDLRYLGIGFAERIEAFEFEEAMEPVVQRKYSSDRMDSFVVDQSTPPKPAVENLRTTQRPNAFHRKASMPVSLFSWGGSLEQTTTITTAATENSTGEEEDSISAPRTGHEESAPSSPPISSDEDDTTEWEDDEEEEEPDSEEEEDNEDQEGDDARDCGSTKSPLLTTTPPLIKHRPHHASVAALVGADTKMQRCRSSDHAQRHRMKERRTSIAAYQSQPRRPLILKPIEEAG